MAKPALKVYRGKRDFTKTAEPSGERRVAPSSRLRFVVQRHAARRLHYDLRLEWQGVFKSWAVTRGPSLDPADKRLAVEVEDHPLDYGDFEGTIPAGEYGGGTVQLWDRGYWTPEGPLTTDQALAKGDLKFTLEGARLTGSWVLVRMKGDRMSGSRSDGNSHSGGKKNNWLLIKHRDASAKPGDADALLAEDASVASRRTMAQIAKGTGKPPKPFMLSGEPAKADAVWDTSGGRHWEDGPAGKAHAAAPAVERPSEISRHAPPAAPQPRTLAKDSKTAAVKVAAIPSFIEPQLSRLLQRPPDIQGWGHEVKFDGYRAQVRIVDGRAVVRTRKGLDWSERFPEIAQEACALPDCLIDGEIVALDDRGLPSFPALQAALSAEKSQDLVFFAFDLLFEGKEDLRTRPLDERKLRLETLLSGFDAGARLRYVAHLQSNAEAVLASACKMGLEGIISKRLDAPYRSGRGDFWVKTKCRGGQEVVLGGWTTEAGRFRSLLAGVYRGGRLAYVGRIGTGYGQAVAKALIPKLEKLTRAASPFSGDNAPAKERDVQWLKPELVAEIEFAGWTGSGMIREAAFKGLRDDKDPKDVVAELPDTATPEDSSDMDSNDMPKKSKTASKTAKKSAPVSAAGGSTVMGVGISKPDKPLWPDGGDGKPVSKLDLAHYLENIGEWLLPHLAGRPCSLVRAPDGIGGQHFFQRHAMAGMSPLFDLVKVRGDKEPYVQIDRVEALAAVAQMGALEMHPWNCAPDDPESAGRLIFDLDPAPEVKFEAVIDAALEIRDRLKKVGLISFCKTTGGKGLHVVTPLKVGKHAVKWPAAKNFAHLICAQMAQDSPTRYLDTMSKSQRTGRIFLDYLRNDRTATAVAVLSPRAREGAAVSMPIGWGEVKKGLAPQKFTVRTAAGLLAKTKPWKDYADGARSLTDAIKQITKG
jgi:bifunctional non-homologous end joining protein LigD